METSLTISSSAALLGAMIILASVPDTSAMAVVARSLTSGFSHGLYTVLGILAGDCIFLVFAVFSLSAIAESMGSLFVIIQYLGSAYLIWLGFRLWRSNSKNVEIQGIKELSWWSSFVCGLFITLGDPKAIIFYMSFLPAFIEMPSASILDLSIILLMAMIAVTGVKLGYAFMAEKARLLFQSSRAKKRINVTAGAVLIGIGLFLAART